MTRKVPIQGGNETAVAISSPELDIALSALRDSLRGASDKTLTDIDDGIGGASAESAGDTGASKTNGYLRWMRDFWFALKGQKTAANSLSVTGSSDGTFKVEGGNSSAVVVGGSTADGSAPTNYAVMAGGKDSGGLKRTLLLKTAGELPVYSPALAFAENWNAALTASWQKVATTTTATKALRMSAACNATAYDIEIQVVTAGGAAPSAGTSGMALLGGDDFPQGIPVGDIYARSATLQKLIVWSV